MYGRVGEGSTVVLAVLLFCVDVVIAGVEGTDFPTKPPKIRATKTIAMTATAAPIILNATIKPHSYLALMVFYMFASARNGLVQ
jgi:hypothetical protein